MNFHEKAKQRVRVERECGAMSGGDAATSSMQGIKEAHCSAYAVHPPSTGMTAPCITASAPTPRTQPRNAPSHSSNLAPAGTPPPTPPLPPFQAASSERPRTLLRPSRPLRREGRAGEECRWDLRGRGQTVGVEERGKNGPGATTLTRIASLAYSIAIAREKPRTACLDAHSGWREIRAENRLAKAARLT